MPFLFDHPRPHTCPLSSRDRDDDGETLLVSQNVWDALGYAYSDGADEVRGLALSREGQTRPVVCWARRDTELADGLSIPHRWTSDDHFFPANPAPAYASASVSVAAVRPVALSEVILSALTSEAYAYAQSHKDALEEWLCGGRRILRQGAVVTCVIEPEYGETRASNKGKGKERMMEEEAGDDGAQPNGDEPDGLETAPETKRYAYRLVMTTPVLQGYATRNATHFYVASPPPGEMVASSASAFPDGVVNDDGTPGLTSEGDATAEELGSDAELEIDEAFLASSVLHSMSSLSSFALASPEPSPPSPTVFPEPNGHAYPNGSAYTATHTQQPTPPHSQIPRSGWTCRAQALSQPVTNASAHGWDDCTVYVRTTDLGRVGVLNGDWAVISAAPSASTSDTSEHESRNKSRLVRVLAAEHDSTSLGTASLSPQLLHNLAGFSSSPSAQPSLSLRSTPFGPARPPLPTARALTIARVASPLSTTRAYEKACLRALRSYFDGARRLVKTGDVISVGVSTDVGPLSSLSTAEDGEEDGLDAELDVGYSGEPNATVFFLVTNIEHGVPRAASVDADDAYAGATLGELGCWVDPSATRIVQAGVEHARVPDVGRYLGIKDMVSKPDARPDSAFARLHALVAATLARHAASYQLPISILLKGPRGVGKCTVLGSVARSLGMHIYEVDCYDVIGENDVQTEGTLRARFGKAEECAPCVLVLRNVDAFAGTTQAQEPGKEPPIAHALQECINDLQQSWRLNGFPVLVVATTSNAERVPARVLACFKHEVTIEAPGEAERHEILDSLLQECEIGPDVSVRELAIQTAALVAADLVDLVNRAKAASIQRVVKELSDNETEQDLFYAGIPLIAADFDVALSASRASYSENIGAPKIPAVSWDDVGGLASVKSDILDTIQLPLERPELFADGLKKRSGILLYGPPGTGKTLLAKAVATSLALNFFSVKGPELLNMYIGESEANVRRVFQRARDARPCVVFFDELDSVAPKRGNHGDSGGVMDRIVSQLLAELDGLSGSGGGGGDVFVIGATNRPDLLDPALLRPGRFDRMLYLGVSTTHAAQLNILQALTRKFRLHPDLKLEDIAERCPFHYTGADFYALCADALLKAMARKAEELETMISRINSEPPDPHHPYPMTPQYYLAELATPAEMEVLVSQDDFEAALNELVASVSQAEMEHYARVQQRFSKVTINAA